MITPLGAVCLVAFCTALLRGGAKGLLAVTVMTVPFYDSAMVNVGAASVTPFYVGAIWYVAIQFYSRRANLHIPAIPGLLIYTSAIVTLVGPWVFAGHEITSGGSGSDQFDRVARLDFTVSNAAQMAYLAINIMLMASLSPGELSSALIRRAMILGSAFAAAGATFRSLWPHEFFDNSDRNHYALIDESLRARSQFAEPSHLGIFAVSGLFFFGASLLTARTPRAAFSSAAWMAVSAYLLILSYSGSAAAGGLLAAAFLAGTFLWSLLSRGALNGRAVAALPFALAATLLIGPSIVASALAVLNQKAGSKSLTIRSYENNMALELLRDSWGLGVGLGSTNTSSLLLLLASSIGLIGLALFLALCAIAMSRSYRKDLATYSGLVATLATSFVSVGLFASPLLWVFLIAAYGCVTDAVRTQPNTDAPTPDGACGRQRGGPTSALQSPDGPFRGMAV